MFGLVVLGFCVSLTFTYVQLDRNGLRPARYLETDDLVCMMSETGVVPKLDESKIIKKGRLGPGQVTISNISNLMSLFPITVCMMAF
jgi:hypothetical protein